MTIKHLIISGGGPLGIRFLSALETLNLEKYWDVNEIESIYGTSIGCILGVMICLKFDWETLNNYIINRPWHDAIKVTPKQLFESYCNKGIFDKKIMEILFKPLFQAKDLSLSITLQEFYNYSNVDLHIFTFEVNSFTTAEYSHITHPNLSLIDAIFMSSSLPGLFIPTIIDKCCYIDGGIMCNYPINECLRDHQNEDECLGIVYSYKGGDKSTINSSVNENASLLDYINCITINSVNYIRDSIKIKKIKNVIKCIVDFNPLTIEIMNEMINNKNMREEWFEIGKNDAKTFLDLMKNHEDNNLKDNNLKDNNLKDDNLII
jgi:predicted acylesterase/phospholipase RssA